MTQVIACKVPISTDCPSGLKIVVPSNGVSIEMALNTIPPDTISYAIIERIQIPSDRYFRDAWELTDASEVKPKMSAALSIHQNELRKMRKPLFEILDAAYLEALETGNISRQQLIATKKQALRDITVDPLLLQATTPEQLKAFIPAILREPLGI